MDVRQMAAFHEQTRAEVTIAAIPVPLKDASSFGVMVTGPGGELQDFVEKPERPLPIPGDPDRAYASMGNYLFNPDVLTELLVAANARGETDFGRRLLPRLVQGRRAFAYNFTDNRVAGVRRDEEQNYWRDIGTLDALAAACQDL
jgi:glucose-1-phosphate adenylyltransferase